MTRIRQQILKRFNVNEHGIITSPGKFEGKMLYVPYFYDLWLEGWADEEEYDEETDTLVAIFYVRDEDIKHFPELEGTRRIEMWESEYGFVHTYEK